MLDAKWFQMEKEVWPDGFDPVAFMENPEEEEGDEDPVSYAVPSYVVRYGILVIGQDAKIRREVVVGKFAGVRLAAGSGRGRESVASKGKRIPDKWQRSNDDGGKYCENLGLPDQISGRVVSSVVDS